MGKADIAGGPGSADFVAKLGHARAAGSRGYRRFEALPLDSRSVTFQQDTENQSVRYQQKWNDCRGNEKRGAELTRQQSSCIGHIERIQQIETTPDIKDPRERNSQLAP